MLPAFHSTFRDNKFDKLSKGHIGSVSFSNLFGVYGRFPFNFVIVCRDKSVKEKWKMKNKKIQFKNIPLPFKGMSYERKSKGRPFPADLINIFSGKNFRTLEL